MLTETISEEHNEMASIPKVVHLMHAVVHFSCLQVKLRGHIHLIDCMCYTEPCTHSEIYNMTESIEILVLSPRQSTI